MSISFIIATISSFSWLAFAYRYVNLPSALTSTDFFQITVILTLPILLIWAIYLAVKSQNNERSMTKILYFLSKQINNSNEDSVAVKQALISAEHELKRGFILQKLDFLIADINELLSDIIKRSNSISSIQMEHLWTRTSGGEHWLIAKTFIEINEYQSGFTMHLYEKASKDTLLKGSILEFDTRYKNLCQLLKEYDNQQIFSNMLEFGALGKTHQILAPLAEKLYNQNEKQQEPQTQFELLSEKPEKHLTEDFPSFLKSEKTKLHIVSNSEQLEEKVEEITEPKHKSEQRPIKEVEPLQKKDPIISGFTQTQSALQSLKSFTDQQNTSKNINVPNKISLDDIVKEINASPENNYNEDEHPLEVLFNDKTNQ